MLMKTIPFNVPPMVEGELEELEKSINSHRICGDNEYTKKCNKWLEDKFISKKALLTTSGSSALDMAALLCDIKQGDEVILPSFTFSSTANAFVLAGATLVFVDIRKDTMNIDETKIENAITDKTKAICVVHYAGVSCEMDTILEIAKKYNLYVVEDAAQGVMSYYKGKALGTIGTFGCYSFHETKNYSMGEGGAILINDDRFIERAEILREKGTNRSKFIRGEVDKYTWLDFGDSYLPSDLNAAYLYPQLLKADEINNDRLASWNIYNNLLQKLSNLGYLDLPYIPEDCVHNAHMYYIKVKDLDTRTMLVKYLREEKIITASHYIPLHSAPAGLKYGRFDGEDINTTKESERLLRLPMYYRLEEKDIIRVIGSIYSFFNVKFDE